jgi:AraC-like DNA-binding protein
MSTLTSSPLRNQQEVPGAPVCPARPDGGSGFGSPTGIQKQTSLPSRRLRQVTEYIQQNLDKDLALADLAAVVCMSPYHFARLFRCSTGVSPHRFVVRSRIARACVFLATEELSIAQISGMVGFRTPSHFATVFRRALGITPGAYRTASLREDRSGGEGGSDGLQGERDGTDL